MIYGERGAARLLGMNPEKLRYRMQQYGLRRPKKSRQLTRKVVENRRTINSIMVLMEVMSCCY